MSVIFAFYENFNLLSFAILILSLIILYAFKWSDSSKFNAKEPPIIPSYLPFFGHMFAFGRDPLNFLLNAYTKYGPVFTFTMLGKRFTYLCDSDAISHFFNAKNEELNAEQVYSSLVTPVFGSGVVYDVPHNIFMEQKKMIKNGLIQARYRVHVPIIERETLAFISQHILPPCEGSRSSLKTKIEINILERMAELIIFTSSACLMGKEARQALTKEVAQWYADLDGGFCIEAWLFPEWMPFPAFKKRDIAHLKIKHLFLHIIAKRRKEKNLYHLLQSNNSTIQNGKQQEANDKDLIIEDFYNNPVSDNDENSFDETDMIDTFMLSRYKSGRYTTDEEIAKLMISLLMAGQHTSSTTSSWLLMFLAKHQNIQEKLYEEIMEHCDVKDVDSSDLTTDVKYPRLKGLDLSLDKLRNLDLLDRCLKETLRLRPPLLTLMRLCKKDIDVSIYNGKKSYTIPQGYQVCVSPTFTQQLQTYWGQGLNAHFNPDRFLRKSIQDNAENSIDTLTNCVGKTQNIACDKNEVGNGHKIQDEPSKCPFAALRRTTASSFGKFFEKSLLLGLNSTSEMLVSKENSNKFQQEHPKYKEMDEMKSSSSQNLENDTGGSTKYAYFPFGGGRHRCVGEAFAYVQIKTLVALLITNFKFTLNMGNNNPPSSAVLLDNQDPSLHINYKTLISTPLKPMIALELRHRHP